MGGRHQGADSGCGVVRLGRLLGVKFRLAICWLCDPGRHLGFFLCNTGTADHQPHRQWSEVKGLLIQGALICGIC